MNLSEALDAALPEIPKLRIARGRPPRIDPDLIVREDVLDGEPIIGVLQRDKGNFFRFPPSQWNLIMMFDGERSYEQIVDLYTAQTGEEISVDDLKIFAQNLDEAGLWYQSPQEKNLALSEKLMAHRDRRAQRKSKINLAHISFSAWDPNQYFGALDRRIGRYVYSNWTLLAVVLLFCFEALVFISKWSVIGPDVPEYFNFTHKGFADIAEFWVLLFVLGFIHESAHGLTCKHYGGEVHSMGLMLLYLTPAFFVDVTETWISATKVQRLATIIAGIWIEMVVCGFAMIVWTNSQPGQWLHEITYKIILITGLAVIVMNLNPLLKLDGYYFFTEIIGVPDLKERSTAFVSGWFQARVLRLPVEVPVVPRRRVLLFTLYAIVSGAYSYLLLFAVIRFTYNVTFKLLAEFALIPAGWLAFVMFRSRLVSLRILAVKLWANIFGSGFYRRPINLFIAAALLVLFFVPIWRDRENAMFVVEPMSSTTLHASVTGSVEAVLVHEGEMVHSGQALLRMTSNNASAMRSSAAAQAGSARFQSVEAQLRGQSIGSAAADQYAANQSSGLAHEVQSSLVIAAPTDGVVLTRDPAAMLNQDVAIGQPLLALASAESPAVRVFVPAAALDRIPPGAEVALSLPGRFSIIRLELAPLDGEAVSLPAGLMDRQNYKGLDVPTFYSARMALPTSAGDLRLGISGPARIFGARRSLFQRLLTVVLNLVRAHVW